MILKGEKMSISDWQKRKLELMAEYFDRLGFLYTIYFEKFKDHRDFWKKMISKSIKNSEWIKSSLNKIEDGVYYYDSKRFNIESIKKSLEYLDKIIKKQSNSDIKLMEALSTALGFETGIISLKFYEIIKTDILAFKECMKELYENFKDLSKFTEIA
jgi:hypothetical protein